MRQGEGTTMRTRWIAAGDLVLALLLLAAVGGRFRGGTASSAPDLEGLIKAKGLTPDQVRAAVQTFVPPGTYAEYLMFSSGGQSGQVLVFGIPSMRLLRVIGVFSPESWQGYGFSEETGGILREQPPAKQALSR